MIMNNAITLALIILCGLVLAACAQTLVQQQYENCTHADHREHGCREGYYVNSDGRCSRKRVCCHCPRNTWMPHFNTCTQCIPHTDCASLGRELIIAGNRTHDNVCGDKLEPVTTHSLSTQIPADVTSIHPPLAITSTTQQQQTTPIRNGPSTSYVQPCPSLPRDEPTDGFIADSGQSVSWSVFMFFLVLLFASVVINVTFLICKYRQRSDPDGFVNRGITRMIDYCRNCLR